MTDFNPYYDWLGIPLAQQPPNHYALLGVQEFEDNQLAIDSAAEQRVAFVRTKQIGQHKVRAQALILEIVAAHGVLGSSNEKNRYDEWLRHEKPVVDVKSLPVPSPEPPPAKPNAPPPRKVPTSAPTPEVEEPPHEDTVKCADCGLLGLRRKTDGDIAEVDENLRETGEPLQGSDSYWSKPICVARHIRFGPIGNGLVSELESDRTCESFIAWEVGSSPSDHMQMVRERDRREQDRRWRREDRWWALGAGVLGVIGTLGPLPPRNCSVFETRARRCPTRSGRALERAGQTESRRSPPSLVPV